MLTRGTIRQAASRARLRRSILAFTLVTFVPLALLAYVAVSFSSATITDEAHASVRRVALLQARVVEVRFDLVTSFVDSSARHVSRHAGGPVESAAMQEELDRLSTTFDGISHVAYLDPAGRLLAISPSAPDLIGQDFSHRDWYRGVVRTGRVYVSEAFQTAAPGQPLVVGIAAPVPSQTTSKVTGYLIYGYKLEAIQGWVGRFSRDQGVAMTVTDQQGVIVASPRQPPGLLSIASEESVRRALAGKTGTLEVAEQGQDLLVGYAPSRTLGWAVRAEVDRTQALAGVQRVLVSVLTIAGVLAAIFLISLVFMARIWQQRGRAEDSLQEREAELSEAQGIGGLGSWRYDLDTDEAAWSPNLLRMTDHARDDRPMGPNSLREIVAEQDSAQFAAAEHATRSTGTPFALDHRVVTTNGGTKWFNTRAEPIRAPDGRITGVRGVCVDIDARKRSELALHTAQVELQQLSDELLRTNDDLSRSNLDLERFASSASHDLAEPLRAISGPIALLARRYQDELDDDANTYIDFAVDGCKRMQSLIDDMLLYSRVGRDTKHLGPVDCQVVLDRVLVSLAPRIEECGAHIEVGPLPVVQADDGQLGQLFQNLLMNAMKFVSAGVPPRIVVTAEPAGTMWKLTVTDNGIGIDPAYREQIFDMFKRLHPRTEYEGTGIGLALCKRIVENFGGALGVSGAPGGAGSSFWFTIPAEQETP